MSQINLQHFICKNERVSDILYRNIYARSIRISTQIQRVHSPGCAQCIHNSVMYMYGHEHRERERERERGGGGDLFV